MIQDTPERLWEKWKATPTPDTLNRVVGSLEPTIHHALISTGSADDPVLRAHARVFAAQGIQKYDPSSGASLATWTSNQLQQLRRLKRQSQAVTQVSETAQLDGLHLARLEREFNDEHGRDPDVWELADISRLPVKRIEKVRRTLRRTPSEEALAGLSQESGPDFDGEAIGYVFRDSDHIDRKIIEMKTGYGGKHEPMTPKAIAIALKLKPYDLSRRSTRIALRLREIQQALQDVA